MYLLSICAKSYNMDDNEYVSWNKEEDPISQACNEGSFQNQWGLAA